MSTEIIRNIVYQFTIIGIGFYAFFKLPILKGLIVLFVLINFNYLFYTKPIANTKSECEKFFTKKSCEIKVKFQNDDILNDFEKDVEWFEFKTYFCENGSANKERLLKSYSKEQICGVDCNTEQNEKDLEIIKEKINNFECNESENNFYQKKLYKIYDNFFSNKIYLILAIFAVVFSLWLYLKSI
tara:strand:- start:349 stop:903 length:555 start_codon:yes stop_codon:yes gene_type:complete